MNTENMATFGSYLKEHREKKGIRLEEIASITKIHIHTLELMEEGKWEKLPPEPFIRGFIIAYAKYVGVEPREAIRLWTEEQVESENLKSPTPAAQALATPATTMTHAEKSKHADEKPEAVLSQDPTLPLGKIAAGFGGLMLLGVILWLMSLGKSSVPHVVTNISHEPAEASAGIANPDALSNATSNTVTPEAKKETVADELARIAIKQEERKVAATTNDTPATTVATTSTATTPAPATSALSHELVVESKERTWAKVVVDNEAPIELFLPSGEKATYRAKEKIKLVLGNSTGSQVTHNGEVADGKKFQGTIRSYIFPSNARFPQDKPKTDSTENATTQTQGSDSQF